MSIATDRFKRKTSVPSRGSEGFPRGAVWWALLLGAIVGSLFGIRYSLPHQPGFLKEVRNHFLFPHVVQTHAILASLALMAGPWQLSASFRAAHPRVHRWLGRIYVADVLAALLVGSFLMPTVTTGFPAILGLSLAGSIWLGFAILGILAIRRRDVQTHRRWMLRSYAIPFASFTIRIYFISMKALGVPFEYNYPASIWLSVLTNMLIMECILRWPMLRAAVDRWRDKRSWRRVDASPGVVSASGASGTPEQ
jgi:uncharacterized membrane protein